MPELPLVSIITPSYNQGRFVEQTILSVLKQDYPQIEYIIIDGGSTDNSLEVIKRYIGRLAYWESQPDRGQAHAINKGLQHAHGEIRGWLNSDDMLLPGTVSKVVNTFNQHPEIDVVYGRVERVDEYGQVIPTPELPKDRLTFNKKFVIGECVVNQPGSFWRLSIQDRVSGIQFHHEHEWSGLLDENLKYVMDFDWWIRLALAGAQFMRLPDVVARFRLSSGSKTVAQSAGMAEEQWLVLQNLLKVSDLPEMLAMDPGQIEQQAQRTQANIALHAFYGYYKQRNWRLARHWLVQALRRDATALFHWRWFALAIASLGRKY